jgi:hypothetical protein
MRRFHVFLAISLLLHTGLFAALALPGFSSRAKAVPVVYEVDIVSGPPGAAVMGELKKYSPPSSVPRIKDFGEISKDLPIKDSFPKLPEPDIDSGSERPTASTHQGQQDRQGHADFPGGSRNGEMSRNEAWAGIVQSRFKQVWQLPEGVPISPNLQATYTIKISGAGDIMYKKLLMSSGNRPFDRSVETALSRIKLPPPPGGRYEWTLTFVPPYSN